MTQQSSPGAGLSRRDALRVAGLSGLAVGLAACSRFGGEDKKEPGKVELEFVWWGDANRSKMTQAALDLFTKKYPHITLKTEFQDAFPYRDKLNTRFAAGSPPDVMAMRNDSVGEYAGKNALLDITTDKIVSLSSIPPAVRQLGTVGGKLVGIPSGLNSTCFVVNKALADQLKVDIPDGNKWSWDDLANFAKQITAASQGKVYGTAFENFNMSYIIPFCIQRGETFFTADGKLGVSEGAIRAWLEMIEKMRAEGGFPPAKFFDVGAGTDPNKGFLAQGKIASEMAPSNSFPAKNANVEGRQLVMLEFPGETTSKRRGIYLGTPHLWSISAKTKHPKEALQLIDFILNDVEAGKELRTTRGVPPAPPVAEGLKSTLETDDQTAMQFIVNLAKKDLPEPPMFPPGGAKLNSIMQTLADEVAFKKKTPAEAAAEFISQGRKAVDG